MTTTNAAAGPLRVSGANYRTEPGDPPLQATEE
jgi:hypothetical protein